MAELNVFDIRMYAAFAFCLLVFYPLGALLIGRLKNPFLSVGVKLSIGSLLFITLMATTHAGARSGMVFYLLLFLSIGIKNRLKPDFSDLKELGIAKVLGIIFCLGMLFTEEGWRSDLLVNEMVYVGNSDVSYYGSFAHEMYRTGWETSPENQTPEMRGLIYHFGDLWFSGFFSNYFEILPYYAYNVLFRSFAIGTIVLMVFGWCQQISKLVLPALIVALVSVVAVYMELFSLGHSQISILQTFSCVYPAYGLGSHLIIVLASVAFSVYLTERNWMLGTVGLLLTPFLNAGLLIVPIISMFILVSLHFGLKLFRPNIVLLWSGRALLSLLIISTIPFVYYILDNRMFETQGDGLISFAFIYLIIHTTVRVVLSQIMVIPFLLGLLYFIRNGNDSERRLALVHSAFYLGTLVSFGLIFPQIQGNSIQILSMQFQGFLVPVCLVGLWGLVNSKESKTLRNISLICLVAIAVQAGRVFVLSGGLRATFDWESYKPGYASTHTMKLEEWKTIRALLKDENTVIGFFICDTNSPGTTDYNEFTYLKAVFPGSVFHRISPLPKDTTLSREMLEAYYRTSLGFFAKKNRFSVADTENELMQFLRPDHIILPKDSGIYCVPDRWLIEYPEMISTENFRIYLKEVDHL